MLDTGLYLSALAADSQAFADLATDLDADVPACPEWKVGDLVSHLGGVYSWVCLALEGKGERPSGHRRQPPDRAGGLLPWFLAGRTAVLDALTTSEPDAPAWNFTGAPDTFSVGWWRRRQALETSIHLVDMQQAFGIASAIDPELAADGVDELLTSFLPRVPVEGAAGTLHLHCTDTDGEWVVDFGGDKPVTRREHAKADAAVRGPAQDLFLLVWNRRPLEGLEVFGPQEAADLLSRVRL